MMKVVLCHLVLLLLAFPSGGQELALYGLDANASQILRISPVSNQVEEEFSSPVLCRPEGACGLAFSGHSLFFVDATDPEHCIYEFSPSGEAVWHSLPAPGGQVDGLAYADGALLVQNFAEDLIYRVDPFDGTVLEEFEPGLDLIGGLAAGQGRIYASQIRPPVVYEIDAESGTVLNEIDAAGSLPTGLAFLGGRLFVGDFTGQRILELDPVTSVVIGENIEATGRFSALASGVSEEVIPYHLRLDSVSENLAADGRIEMVLRAGLYDDEGRLMHTNQHTEIRFVTTGLEDEIVQVEAGEAEMAFMLDPGSDIRFEAKVPGLASVVLDRQIIAPVTHMMMHFAELDDHLIEVEVELFDGTGKPALGDTSALSFGVMRGLGAIVGPEVVKAQEGKARTWIRIEGRDTDLVIAAEMRDIVHSGGFQVSKFDDSSAANTKGFAVSARRVAGRDQLPPAPPTEVQAWRLHDQVEIRWELSADDGDEVWFEFGQSMVHRRGVEGYRIYRSRNGGLYEEVGSVGSGIDHFVDTIARDGAIYRYKVMAADKDNWHEALILPGSDEDRVRTVTSGAVGLNDEGEQVYGLFDDDLDVDFDDFFLFADHFGREEGEGDFDSLFDLNGDGAVSFDDFFILADHFGQQADRR